MKPKRKDAKQRIMIAEGNINKQHKTVRAANDYLETLVTDLLLKIGSMEDFKRPDILLDFTNRNVMWMKYCRENNLNDKSYNEFVNTFNACRLKMQEIVLRPEN